MCFMPRRPPRSPNVLSRRKLLKRAPIRNTTKSPSISAIILRPVMSAMISLPAGDTSPPPGQDQCPLSQSPGELPGGGGRVVGLGDGPDHDHPGGPGREHLAEPVQADAADREP